MKSFVSFTPIWRLASAKYCVRSASRVAGGHAAHLLVEQLRRPAAPGQRASADGEDQPAVIERRMIHPRHAQVGSAAHGTACSARAPAARTARPRARECAGCASMSAMKRCSATTEPKVPPPMTMTSKLALCPATVSAALSRCLLQRVAEKAPHVVQREGRRFRGQQLRHGMSPDPASLTASRTTPELEHLKLFEQREVETGIR